MQVQIRVFHALGTTRACVARLDTRFTFRELTAVERNEMAVEICEEVFLLLNNLRPTEFWETRLYGLRESYDAHRRSLSVGDMVEVWLTNQPDDCAQARVYAYTAQGVQRRLPATV